ncbi:MAG: DNA/RNA non-specific endonuclease [Helicobacteraceae bacterium]|nr:DNA/RNA non-specific endonuclease [Helicobacteraceae bacterium]
MSRNSRTPIAAIKTALVIFALLAPLFKDKRGKFSPIKIIATCALIAILSAALYLRELKLREDFFFYGEPKAENFCRILRNDGYLSCYSDILGEPLWVAYRLRAAPRQDLPRPKNFEADIRAFYAISPESYTRSGYDRGHLAPNHAIAQIYGKTAQKETFLMTNIAPQKPDLNRKVWQRMEQTAFDVFAPKFGEVWVVKGGVFGSDAKRINGVFSPVAPDGFFAIYAAINDDEIAFLAFLAPQDVKGDEPIGNFVVSVNDVETLTKIDFFSALPDDLEEELEGEIAAENWGNLSAF